MQKNKVLETTNTDERSLEIVDGAVRNLLHFEPKWDSRKLSKEFVEGGLRCDWFKGKLRTDGSSVTMLLHFERLDRRDYSGPTPLEGVWEFRGALIQWGLCVVPKTISHEFSRQDMNLWN